MFDEYLTDLIDVCPHCNTKAHLRSINSESYTNSNRDVVFYTLLRCVPCKKLILKTHYFRQNPYNKYEDLTSEGWKHKFPGIEVTYAGKFEGPVPPLVLEDFKEGVICLYNKCFRASVAMFRRSLQSALLEHGAEQTKDLIDQIKDAPFLTKEIKDWSHSIRIFGNWGAHPQDDNLKDIDETTAEETKSFLEEFFNYVYVMPSRVAEARQKNPPKSTTQKPAASC